MAIKYTKTISGDFGGNFNSSQFKSEVEVDDDIIPTCTHINVNDDNIDIWFDTTLSAGEQTTLNELVSYHTIPIVIGEALEHYDALVSADGNGDYLLPSAAFNAGAKTVYIRTGTYVESSDITIPNNGVLVGETVAPVVIYFAGPFSVKIDGSGGSKEISGTISITNCTTDVIGTGTTFTNLTTDDYILLGQNFYQIASITDNTNLILSENYKGRSINNQSYVAQSMHTGVNISNLIITNSSGTGLYMRAVRGTIIHCCGLLSNNIGLEMVDSSTNSITSVNCYNNTIHGMSFNDSYSISLANGETYNNGSNGIDISGNSSNIVFNGALIANNNTDGVNISGTVTNVLINDCTMQRNNEKGINTGINTTNVVIDGTLICYNGSSGVDFEGSNNILSNCIISYSGICGIHTGANGTITGNHVFNNTTIGIDMTGDSNCRVSCNNIYNNSGDGIYMDGDNNGISDNFIRNNGSEGIMIVGGIDNDVNGNTIADNTSDGVKLSGQCASTIFANNRIKNNVIGIDVPSMSDDCVISGNIITGNSSHGIIVAANYCIITGNRCKLNGGDGCVIANGGTGNTTKINGFVGNSGADLIDNGNGTIKDI